MNLFKNCRELQASKMSVAKQLAEINSRLQQEQEEGLRKTASLGFMKEQYQQSNEELHHHKNTGRNLLDFIYSSYWMTISAHMLFEVYS